MGVTKWGVGDCKVIKRPHVLGLLNDKK